MIEEAQWYWLRGQPSSALSRGAIALGSSGTTALARRARGSRHACQVDNGAAGGLPLSHD